MKIELELKHLAAYLPYGLNMLNKINEIDILTTYNVPHALKHWKPILRPLSDLHKEITHNGQKIIPFVELAKIAGIRSNTPEYVNTDEYQYPDEPEYITPEYLWLYGAKFETGKAYSAAPECQEFLIIYPPKIMNEGFDYAFLKTIHFQHRQHVHFHDSTHPVRNITQIIEKLQEWHFDYMGLMLSGLAIDINSLENK